jgi:hypothetical protein
MSVERYAVKRRGRRTSDSLMLHQCPCGGIVRFNGLFDGGQQAEASRLLHSPPSEFPRPT